MLRYALFPSTLGSCGLAWNDRGVLRLQLPAASETATVVRLTRVDPHAHPARPTASIARVIMQLQKHLAGVVQDFSAVAIDLEQVPLFHRLVYAQLCAVQSGKTITYGALAHRVGRPRAARAVGAAMARNPCPILIPCHRVIAADGTLGGFTAPSGVATKRWLLEREATAIAAAAR